MTKTLKWLSYLAEDEDWDDTFNDGLKKVRKTAAREAIDLIQNGIAAHPVEMREIEGPRGKIAVYSCRNCREVLEPNFNYCPHCGDRLQWEETKT